MAMFILQALYFTWGVYNYIGIVSGIYGMFNMGKDGVMLIYKIAKYVGGGKGKKQPELTDSFLIEKRDLENNWQDIKLIKL